MPIERPWRDSAVVLNRFTFLDDPLLNLSYVATDVDELGIPRFSPRIPRKPVVLFERCRPHRSRPGADRGHDELWTRRALARGLQRISGDAVLRLPGLPGWTLGPLSRPSGDHVVRGLQLRQPGGALFAAAVGEPAPGWIGAAEQGWVLVLHAPRLGRSRTLKPLSGTGASAEQARMFRRARADGLVTGGIVAWHNPATSAAGTAATSFVWPPC